MNSERWKIKENKKIDKERKKKGKKDREKGIQIKVER